MICFLVACSCILILTELATIEPCHYYLDMLGKRFTTYKLHIYQAHMFLSGNSLLTYGNFLVNQKNELSLNLTLKLFNN